MPIYEYYCHWCDKHTNLFRSMNEDRDNKECPICKHDTLERLVSNSISVTHETNVGELVKDFIKENKEINKQEKERLSRQEYKK